MMKNDKLLAACNKVWQLLQQFDLEQNYNPQNAIKLANDISITMSSAGDGIGKYEFADAYLNEIRKSGMLNPKRTSIAGRSPFWVCCALYGLWTAVPLLIQEGVIGEHNLSAFINFSYDLLDWIIELQ